MDEEFLHRLRRKPSPAFAARLKQQLARHEAARAGASPFGFLRGAFGVVLLGGAVAAGVAAVALSIDASRFPRADSASGIEAPLIVHDAPAPDAGTMAPPAADAVPGANGDKSPGDAVSHAKPANSEAAERSEAMPAIAPDATRDAAPPALPAPVRTNDAEQHGENENEQ